MNEKKSISWQFADDYYRLLIAKLGRIDYYLSLEEFEFAFKELRQIYAQLINSIQREKKEFDGNIQYEIFKKLIEDIHNKLFEYNIMQLKESKSKTVLIRHSKLKYQLENDIYNLYEELMKTIDKLNMLFPRQKIDDRLAIYKQ